LGPATAEGPVSRERTPERVGNAEASSATGEVATGEVSSLA